MDKHYILCVDDEQDNVEALERIFRKKFHVLKALSGDEGLATLSRELKAGHKVALIISDQRMPGQTGVEFLKASMAIVPEAIRILLTGYTDIESVVGAINSGQVYRYIAKPWDPVDLANTVDKAIEKYDLTAELSEKNRALKSALAELQTLDAAKNQFMILINHELKTPLTAMISFSELLKESDLDEEQKLYVKRILQSADRLKKLVDDSLLFVTAQTGKQKISKKKVALKDLLSGLREHFDAQASARKQSLQLKVIPPEGKGAAKDLTGKIDPLIFEEVLSRLIDNAIAHGKADSEVLIEAKIEDKDAVVTVINEGKAISEKIIERVKEPFNLDEDIMKHSTGTGMGLSVVHALLTAHGGDLDFSHARGLVSVRARFGGA
jgi:two-component system, sensor histidine kinase and response regulator